MKRHMGRGGKRDPSIFVAPACIPKLLYSNAGVEALEEIKTGSFWLKTYPPPAPSPAFGFVQSIVTRRIMARLKRFKTNLFPYGFNQTYFWLDTLCYLPGISSVLKFLNEIAMVVVDDDTSLPPASCSPEKLQFVTKTSIF